MAEPTPGEPGSRAVQLDDGREWGNVRTIVRDHHATGFQVEHHHRVAIASRHPLIQGADDGTVPEVAWHVSGGLRLVRVENHTVAHHAQQAVVGSSFDGQDVSDTSPSGRFRADGGGLLFKLDGGFGARPLYWVDLSSGTAATPIDATGSLAAPEVAQALWSP